MKIPYNEDLRPDTGLYNAKLGIWLFLASEVMLFGALFSAYIMLRTSDPYWFDIKPKLNIPLATLNTVFLITSSVTMVMSWVSLKLKDLNKFKLYLGLTLLCSFGFLIVKYFEYSAKTNGLYRFTYKGYLNIEYTDTKWCDYINTTYPTSMVGVYPENDYEMKRLINTSIIKAGSGETKTAVVDTENPSVCSNFA